MYIHIQKVKNVFSKIIVKSTSHTHILKSKKVHVHAHTKKYKKVEKSMKSIKNK